MLREFADWAKKQDFSGMHVEVAGEIDDYVERFLKEADANEGMVTSDGS
jgi:hypothetical protein